MAPGVLPLSVLCQNVLLQHHLALRDLGDTRFMLLRRVLMKCTPAQLMNLEKWNPTLVLEDEDIWTHVVQREFPLSVQQRYTRDPSKIKKFYKQQLEDLGFDYSHLKLDNYIRYEELGNTKKFKLPSKLLYLKLRQEYEDKEKAAIETLRQRRLEEEQSKERNKVIHIDAVIPVGPISKPFGVRKPAVSNRSPLFQKAQDEAKKRRQLFRNPSQLPPDQLRPMPTVPKAAPVILPAIPLKPTPTKPPANTAPMLKSTSPIRKPVSSIFHQPRRRPMPKRPVPVSPGSSSQPQQQQQNLSSPPPPSEPQSPAQRPPKKIKLGEYIARNSSGVKN